jgi:VanZ family protein
MAVMALIFVLSAQSGLKVSEDVTVDKPFRITGHLLAFASLAGLCLVALSAGRRPRRRDAALALAITVLYGASDELHQSFVPDRTGRLDDLWVDAAGALVGIVVAWAVLTAASGRQARQLPVDGGARGSADRPDGGSAHFDTEGDDPQASR